MPEPYLAYSHIEQMILFITRKYPPSVGGMERLWYQLTTRIAEQTQAQVISWGRSRVGLPFFMIWAFIKASYFLLKDSVTLIHLSDPLLAPLGIALRTIKSVPVVINVHGLDITYPNCSYQALVPVCLRLLDHIICISRYTLDECIKRRIPAGRCTVIPPGVNVDEFAITLPNRDRESWLSSWGIYSPNKKILMTSGRLVPRKGVARFVSEALPLLMAQRQDWVYLIVGDGPERRKIEAAVSACGLSQQVRLLGKIEDRALRAAYALADVFVMPNIPVPGDPEGFGIVVLEARASGVPVIASGLEGISEAVGGKEDGTLVEPENWPAFVDAIEWWLNQQETTADRERRRERVKKEFDWSCIIPRYLELFQEIERNYHFKEKIQDANSD